MSLDLPALAMRGASGAVLEDPWAKACRLSIGWRVEGCVVPRASLTVTLGGRPARRAILEAIFGKNWEASREYDVLVAWRCLCERQHRVIYRDEDLPAFPGYHDACPLCGSAPLEVLP